MKTVFIASSRIRLSKIGLLVFFLQMYDWWRRRESESEVAQLCLTLCDPMDCSPPGSSVHGIFQAIVLEWVAISFSKGSSQPRDRTRVSRIVDRCFTIWATEDTCTLMSISELFTIARTWKKPRWPLADEWIRKLWYIYTVEYSVQFSCSVVSDSIVTPMDYSLPGSSVHGIFQAIVLEWVAISFSRGSSQPRDWTQVSRIAGRRFTIWATREALNGCIMWWMSIKLF